MLVYHEPSSSVHQLSSLATLLDHQKNRQELAEHLKTSSCYCLGEAHGEARGFLVNRGKEDESCSQIHGKESFEIIAGNKEE